MARADHLRLVRARPVKVERKEGLPLRLSDVVITSMASLAAAYLVIAGRWVPGWAESAVAFALIGAGPLVLRVLARKFPQGRVFEFIAAFWLLPTAVFSHAYMGPITDAVNPRLLDAKLAMADVRLFGQHPGMLLEQRMGPVATDFVMVCYYLYYLWPVLLGLALFFRGNRRVFDEFILALALFFALNFVLYVAVPAIGPRFFLADSYEGPLKGLLLTPYLDSLMRQAVFTRDCFPSGHTGITLTVLVYAFWHRRSFFWVMLPFAVGLVLGTLVGRFHYAVDLLCAIPLMIGTVTLAGFLVKARPQGVVVPRPAFEFREA